MPIQCQIVTQDKVLFEGPVDIVVAPGTMGEMGILPNHAPLLTTLAYGVLRLREGGREHAFTIAGGVMEVRPQIVTVLADVGERIEEIDEERAESAKARAEDLLKQGLPPDTDQYLAIQSALRKSNLRLDAVRRYRRGRQKRTPSESGQET